MTKSGRGNQCYSRIYSHIWFHTLIHDHVLRCYWVRRPAQRENSPSRQIVRAWSCLPQLPCLHPVPTQCHSPHQRHPLEGFGTTPITMSSIAPTACPYLHSTLSSSPQLRPIRCQHLASLCHQVWPITKHLYFYLKLTHLPTRQPSSVTRRYSYKVGNWEKNSLC